MSVKFGVLGCADIARKTCVAIAEAPNASCVAVASRSKEKAEAWVNVNCPGARAYGSYDELLDDPEVQVVYLPMPTGMRAEWALKAIAKKKHILCEKPLVSMRDCSTIIDACRKAGVQFMDNTMFMHNERLTAMRKVMDSDSFGAVSHVVTGFTLPFGNDEDWAKGNIRMSRATEPLGCLGDLGWYCVRFSLWAYNYDLPESVSCHFLQETSEGVPLHCTGLLKFSGGRTASFDCSFKHGLRSNAEVVGKHKFLTLDDFVIPSSTSEVCFQVSGMTIADKALTFGLQSSKETVTGGGCVQHTRLIEKLASVVGSGELDEFWPKVTLQTQLVLSALVKSARASGAWVTPREADAAASKGRAQGRQKSVLQKAKFTNVAKIIPAAEGLNLKVKVVSVKPSDAASSDVVVGDASGVVTVRLRGEEQVKLGTEGKSLILRNAHVKMVNGFINMQVNQWGKIEVNEESLDFEPKSSKDVSATEYELS